MAAPEAPPSEVMKAFAKCPIVAAPKPEVVRPHWLSQMCWNRLVMTDTSITSSVEEGALSYLFLFATQSPLRVHFLPLRLLGADSLPCIQGMSPSEAAEACSGWSPFRFEVAGVPVTSDSLDLGPADGLFVYLGVTFDWPETGLASSLQAIPMNDFLAGRPKKVAPPKKTMATKGTGGSSQRRRGRAPMCP